MNGPITYTFSPTFSGGCRAVRTETEHYPVGINSWPHDTYPVASWRNGGPEKPWRLSLHGVISHELHTYNALELTIKIDEHNQGRLYSAVLQAFEIGLGGSRIPDNVKPEEYQAEHLKAAMIGTYLLTRCGDSQTREIVNGQLVPQLIALRDKRYKQIVQQLETNMTPFFGSIYYPLKNTLKF
jgi:hypothetical protein